MALNPHKWDNQDPMSMASFIRRGQLPLTDSEGRLVAKAEDYYTGQMSVYDLFDLNVLCWMTLGYNRRDGV